MPYNRNKRLLTCVFLASIGILPVKAQDRIEATAGMDLVSSYIWRGQDLGGVSIQPVLGLSYKGLSLEVWGSVGFDKTDNKEIDFTLGYSRKGFSLSLTDYWNSQTEDEEGCLVPLKFFGQGREAHLLEVQAGYDLGFLAIGWYTNLAGADGTRANGKRAYSSYLSLATPFRLGGIGFTAEAGAVPWETDFYEGNIRKFAVTNISLAAEKEIIVTKSFSIPIFAKISVNPCTEKIYFTAGLTL